MKKFSRFSIEQAAKRVGVSPNQVAALVADLEERSAPPVGHRRNYPRKSKQCSLPPVFSQPEEPAVTLYYDTFVSSKDIREVEVLAFWGTYDPSRCAYFRRRPEDRRDEYLKLVLEVLIATKSRRAPIAGLSDASSHERLSLQELVGRVAERGAQLYGWFDGSVPASVAHHSGSPAKILSKLTVLQERFRCLHLEKPEGWGSLTAEVALISAPTLVSIMHPAAF